MKNAVAQKVAHKIVVNGKENENMKKDYDAMTVAELKELCKKRKLTGYSKMKKAEIISLLEARDEEKRVLAKKTVNDAREQLGDDFGKAVSFYTSLYTKPHIENYPDVVRIWKNVSVIASSFENGTIDGADMLTVAKIIRIVFKVPVSNEELEGYAMDKLTEFVRTYVEQFRADTTTETLHKDNYKILKCGLDDVEVIDGVCYFDSSKATILTQDEIKIMREENGGKVHAMRVVETSENGISRLLEELGYSTTYVMLYMGEVAGSEEDILKLYNFKKDVFRNGIWDKATGVHYNFGIKGPSMDRKANHLYIPVASWEDTFNIWFKITGTKDKDGFVRAFGTEVVFAKMLARVSTRGSSSFDLSKINPEVAEEIAKARVKYVEDTTTTVTRTYKQLVAPNVLEEKNGEREITDGDGQGLASVIECARFALAMRVISGNEFDAFVILWQKHRENEGNLATVVPSSKLGRLISKIPHVWQIRHGEKKGLLVMSDLETYAPEWDIIIPDSVRKFVGGEWSDYPLEICSFLKKKNSTVNLNPQFIESLEWDNPNALIEIVKDRIQFMEDTMTDPAKRMEFHKTFVTDDDGRGSILSDALLTDSSLMNEMQVQKWSYTQYEKAVNDMMIGKVTVPGMYSYLVFDPNYLLNKWFGLDIPTLQSGEFYFNGKDCECGLFRSPLIHPFEAQRVQLVSREDYWYLTDCAVFNGFDGTADRMGGADFDGDTAAIVPADTWQGEIIVNGIRCLDYDVWEPAQKAKKAYFVPDVNDADAMENLISHLAQGAQTDRTGMITNYASRALDITNHIKSAMYFARLKGLDTITFKHPKEFGKEQLFGSYTPCQIINNSFVVKGIVCGKWTQKPEGSGNWVVEWNDDDPEAVLGVKTLAECEDIVAEYMRLVEILRVLQGREIDGAKTGVFAEGVSGEDFTPNVMIKNTPHCMLTRQVSLGRRDGNKKMDKVAINSYMSLSPWGRVHDYVRQYFYNADGSLKVGTCLDTLKNNGVDKSFVLSSLLTQEERDTLSKQWKMSDGSMMNLIQMMQMRKTAFSTTIKAFKEAQAALHEDTADKQAGNVEESDVTGTLSIASIKEKEYEVLCQYAEMLGVTMEEIAVACYFATYAKDGNIGNGLAYAWICPDALLSVFSRNNGGYGWVRVPNSADIVEVKDGILMNGENTIKQINAFDGEYITKLINNRRYAWVHMKGSEVKPSAIEEVYGNAVYTVNIHGMRYYVSQNVEGWKAIVASNGFMFDLKLSADGRMEMYANVQTQDGQVANLPIASIASGVNSVGIGFLNGKRVKVVNKPSVSPIKFNANSISNVQIMVLA